MDNIARIMRMRSPGIVLRAKLENRYLRELMTYLNTISDEVVIKIWMKSISGDMVDPAHIMLMDWRLFKTVFKSYWATDAKDSKMAVDVKELLKFLKEIGLNEEVAFAFDREKKMLYMASESFYYEFNTLDPEGYTDPKSLNFKLPSEWYLKNGHLRKALKVMGALSDRVEFEREIVTGENDVLKIKCSSDKDSSMLFKIEAIIPQTRSPKIEPKNATVRSLFPMEYLFAVIKKIPDTTEITLTLGEDYPVIIDWPIAEGHGVSKVYLAPRIESEDC